LGLILWLRLRLRNRRRCFQGYQGDIVCPTRQSSRTHVFYLVCQLPCAVLRQWYETVSDFQECMKIQSDLNKLSAWCDRNSLLLNVDKYKTITLSRIRYRCRVCLYAGWNGAGSGKLYKQSGGHHGREDEFFGACGRKAFAMLGFIRIRLSFEFRDPYNLKSLYTSLVRSKLENASCVWSPFYDVHVDKVERVQRRFIRYALRGLDWTDTYDLPPYKHWCALLRLETLVKRRSIACIMFKFDILSGRICFHRTNYGVHEPMFAAMRDFNEVFGLFDFI
jgi:hypothetical protein